VVLGGMGESLRTIRGRLKFLADALPRACEKKLRLVREARMAREASWKAESFLDPGSEEILGCSLGAGLFHDGVQALLASNGLCPGDGTLYDHHWRRPYLPRVSSAAKQKAHYRMRSMPLRPTGQTVFGGEDDAGERGTTRDRGAQAPSSGPQTPLQSISGQLMRWVAESSPERGLSILSISVVRFCVVSGADPRRDQPLPLTCLASQAVQQIVSAKRLEVLDGLEAKADKLGLRALQINPNSEALKARREVDKFTGFYVGVWQALRAALGLTVPDLIDRGVNLSDRSWVHSV